jgi:3-phosphoshikimate 1-carboxyvinyltransferase
MHVRPIRPARRPLDAVLQAVPSKSVTHRALVAAALARGPSTLHGPLRSDDTEATREGLRALGVDVETHAERWVVDGCGGDLAGGAELDLGASGTSLRFLAAVAALGRRPTLLDGSPRLRERPMEELGAALATLGCAVSLGPSRGGLPLRAGGRSPQGGAVRLPGARSSQFASALLLVGARLPAGLALELEAPAVSLPYVALTVEVLRAFGVTVEEDPAALVWRVRATDYAGRAYRVEGDHSSASCFLAAAALAGGRVRVEGLAARSVQPDARLGAILRGLGCVVSSGECWVEVRGTGRVPGFRADLTDAPDLAPTLAALALFAEGPCTLSGIGHLRLKESDRLDVLASNLRRLGRDASASGDRLELPAPRSALRGGIVRTAADHRVAMAFAVAGLRLEGTAVDDSTCVTKSNPGFWSQLQLLEGR